MSDWALTRQPGLRVEEAHFDTAEQALDGVSRRLVRAGQHLTITPRGAELGGGVDVYLVIQEETGDA